MEPIQVGKYTIVDKIGEGAMGVVYKAHDPTLHRYVAIKTISHSHDADPEHRQRFLREARSAAQLNHSNIVTIFDFGEDQGRIFMAMELLEGKDLKDLIREKNPLGIREKLLLMEQICEGVGYAHSKGVVHRDLKPGNIHVQQDGKVKIMDFGLARFASSDITKTGVILGTPNYMSPEQVQAHPVDARSDVFSLGAVFYELLCNRKPFDADSVHATLFKVVQGEREPMSKWNPNLPEPVVRIIDKALSKETERRFHNARELQQALEAVRTRLGQAIDADDIWSSDLQETMVEEPPTPRAHPSTQGHKPTPPEPSLGRRSSSRRTFRRSEISLWKSPWITYAGGGLLILALAGMAFHLFGVSPEPRQEGALPADGAAIPSDPGVLSTLGRARESLEANDYSQAMILAQRVLETEPSHTEATQIYDEAAATLEKLDQSLDEARALLDSGEEEQAARKLAVALAIHPTHPLAVELSKELDRHSREQAEATRHKKEKEAAERARALAAERAELDKSASQWARRRAAALNEAVQSQPAFQNALALESEAKRLASQENYTGAVSAYEQAMRRLDEAQEAAREAERARAAEQLSARTESIPAPPPKPSPPTTTSVPVAERETGAIREVLAKWVRAIETQDIDLYRSAKPNLSGQDEERLKASFQAVDEQHVTISILTIELQGNRASVRVARNDTFVANGRNHNSSTEQVLTFSKEAGGWVIVEIGQ